mmetsp:Transcript_115190/g.326356  ORF Transcript_115190/g.326356 Transcript_115190/m.326356 type:complete len:312 (+) Transcript_115190:234-1169(+)
MLPSRGWSASTPFDDPRRRRGAPTAHEGMSQRVRCRDVLAARGTDNLLRAVLHRRPADVVQRPGLELARPRARGRRDRHGAPDRRAVLVPVALHYVLRPTGCLRHHRGAPDVARGVHRVRRLERGGGDGRGGLRRGLRRVPRHRRRLRGAAVRGRGAGGDAGAARVEPDAAVGDELVLYLVCRAAGGRMVLPRAGGSLLRSRLLRPLQVQRKRGDGGRRPPGACHACPPARLRVGAALLPLQRRGLLVRLLMMQLLVLSLLLLLLQMLLHLRLHVLVHLLLRLLLDLRLLVLLLRRLVRLRLLLLRPQRPR